MRHESDETPDRAFLDPVAFARDQRRHHTPAERALWQELRAKKTGFKFVGQMRIGRYFADFCCPSRKLVVELDGESHERRVEEDEARDGWLRSQGFLVIRFSNEDVLDGIEQVVEEIRRACEARPQWRY